ncbi:MAG: hypothetical protein JNL67_17165 [Planctomycetaceae bacterium]|nr:hypothetical protein [Planctomycetaceae bacterium]
MQDSEPDSPPQNFPTWRYGLAVVFGMAIGLVPKDSAACYLLALLGLFSPGSLPVMAVSTLVFSWLGPSLDSISDPLGYWVLTQPSLSSVWQMLETVPGHRWFQFQNSVVVGSIVISAGAAIPVFFIAKSIARWWQCWMLTGSSGRASAKPTFATELE